MLVLTPDTLEVQMLRKIVSIMVLCLPTVAKAEVVEFVCIQKVSGAEFPFPVKFDTTSHSVSLNFEDWIDATVWSDKAIIWSYVDNGPTAPSINSFMFKRETSELLNSQLSLFSFKSNDLRVYPEVINCNRPF